MVTPGDTTTRFEYRLPLTWVRVVGTSTVTTDELADVQYKETVEHTAVVTTEAGVDPLTRFRVAMTAPELASSKTAWTLMPDGRLTNADTSTTVEPMARWKTGLEVGAFVLAAGVAVAATATPLGWLALGGAAAGAGIHSVLRAGQLQLLKTPTADGGEETLQSVAVHDADPSLWKINNSYEINAARELANYRQALADGGVQHAKCVRRVLAGDAWAQGELQAIEWAMRSATIGALRAEEAYSAWMASKKTKKISPFDYKWRIDDLPDEESLKAWCDNRKQVGDKIWATWVLELKVAVTVDLDELIGSTDVNRKAGRDLVVQLDEDEEDTSVIHYRQSRPATIRTWKLVANSKSNSYAGFRLEQVNVHRALVAYPGNEAVIHTQSTNSASKTVTASFDENGALTKIAGDDVDPSLQRAHDISALIPGVAAAATAGQGFGQVFAAPSLTDRAAELEAAQKLGLITKPADPNQVLKDQLEVERLRAQLNISRQLATASSPAFVVTVADGS